MKPIIVRSFVLDGDECKVSFVFNEKLGKYFGEYPDFDEAPRFTPGGKRWVNVSTDACQYATDREGTGRCLDCGSCKYMLREKEGDLIGVCTHDPKPTQNN